MHRVACRLKSEGNIVKLLGQYYPGIRVEGQRARETSVSVTQNGNSASNRSLSALLEASIVLFGVLEGSVAFVTAFPVGMIIHSFISIQP